MTICDAKTAANQVGAADLAGARTLTTPLETRLEKSNLASEVRHVKKSRH
jgi:hypothetical protein